jgi:hypothetical protein
MNRQKHAWREDYEPNYTRELFSGRRKEPNMDMNKYQSLALLTAEYPKDQGLTYVVVSLAGEVGELCNTYKKRLRGDDTKPTPAEAVQAASSRRDKLLSEYRGALWYMAALAHELGTTMGAQAELNLKELAERKARGTIKGTGDDR